MTELCEHCGIVEGEELCNGYWLCSDCTVADVEAIDAEVIDD